jgi:hypothetical protein
MWAESVRGLDRVGRLFEGIGTDIAPKSLLDTATQANPAGIPPDRAGGFRVRGERPVVAVAAFGGGAEALSVPAVRARWPGGGYHFIAPYGGRGLGGGSDSCVLRRNQRQ